MTIAETDFGSLLASVGERDIDLLLMEEFHVNDEFVSWFCKKLGLGKVFSAGAWHSVSDTDHETDLLLRVLVGGRRVEVLIKNNVSAPEQDRQAQRYHIRGVRQREPVSWTIISLYLCAPEYLNCIES